MGWSNLALPYFNIGARQVFHDHWDPKRVLKTITQERLTNLPLVPTMWRLLLREDVESHDLSSLPQVGFAGEVMDLPTLEAMRRRVCPRIINCYSTTEAAVSGGTAMFPEDLARPDKIESVGKPLLNSEVRVVAAGGSPDQELAPGEEGEILISGPSLAQEFWCDPPLSREKFVGPWLRSGDLGTFDADGYLYVRGRVDDMIVSGGINVMPGLVENMLWRTRTCLRRPWSTRRTRNGDNASSPSSCARMPHSATPPWPHWYRTPTCRAISARASTASGPNCRGATAARPTGAHCGCWPRAADAALRATSAALIAQRFANQRGTAARPASAPRCSARDLPLLRFRLETANPQNPRRFRLTHDVGPLQVEDGENSSTMRPPGLAKSARARCALPTPLAGRIQHFMHRWRMGFIRPIERGSVSVDALVCPA
ncbi:class I adenylate-forming enzyme family protein [Immundisolibacter sp.]